jgi:N-acetylglucosamine-6-phosphate deacetylase
VTSEVRVSDVMDPDSPTLYRLLAGGLTTAHVLHGSANPIGGQSAHIKILLGATPASLQVVGAPPSIKFALGENVKQSNWGDEYTTRYPQTRMGVEQVLRQSFLAARDYRDSWARYDADDPTQIAPRRNLQLEALAEILEGKRLLHCHSYRQDEILMLLQVADEFGFRIAALQHVLEGYKVAPEIARYGAGASTFSDWWAYKFEVYDAIPYNGALMHQAGVVVSFNSDSSELARRLNLEAAKAVKYGGLSAQDALNFVTLNPAKQLGLQERLGSLEPGKEADFVLWSGDPLSNRTVVDETWVKGVLYFQRSRDPERREALSAEREALIAAARAAEKKEGKKGKEGKKRGKPDQEVTR